ncbi:MAG: hypothetical protein FKY71_18130, partial [Spiribacter salinus]
MRQPGWNMSQAIEQLNAAIRRGMRAMEKPEPMRLSEWAEKHFYLSPESSYVEGGFKPLAYQAPIMDAISNDDVREVWMPKSARLGYTKIIIAALLYFAHHKRRNSIIYRPTDAQADKFVQTEIDTAIRDVSVMREVANWIGKSKHPGNKVDRKTFTGSVLYSRGGNAANNYRDLTADVVIYDELDGFVRDVEGEGDPVSLGNQRLEGATFPTLIGGSTPTVLGESLIEEHAHGAEAHFRYHVPCPHCGHEQSLVWGGDGESRGIKFDSGTGSLHGYLCESCGVLFSQAEYMQVMDRGRYIDGNGRWIESGIFRSPQGDPITPPSTMAFMGLWRAYSPMSSWADIVANFLASYKDASRLKTWTNTTLGESWEEPGEKIAWNVLLDRREDYEGIPDGVRVRTVGVDIQKERIECEHVGWGAGEESWSLDYQIIPGDTTGREVWDDLAELMAEWAPHAACIDAGYRPRYVRSFARKRRWVFPIKGQGGPRIPLIETDPRKRAKRLRKRLRSEEADEPIGVDEGKGAHFRRLKVDSPGPGYCHFPHRPEYDQEYFEQLTGAKLVYRKQAGRTVKVWEDSRPRVEALDCRVYAHAALILSG